MLLWAIELAGRDLLDGKSRIGWYVVLRAWAAPGLLAMGFPLGRSSLHPLGVALSVPLWLLIGYATARVATRNPMAQFRDFWRAYGWFVGAVLAGVVAAMVGVTVIAGESLLVGI